MSKETAQDKIQALQKQITTTKNKIAQMSAERASLEPAHEYMPARDLLANEFYKNGKPVVPQMSKNALMQMLQLAMMRKTNAKQK